MLKPSTALGALLVHALLVEAVLLFGAPAFAQDAVAAGAAASGERVATDAAAAAGEAAPAAEVADGKPDGEAGKPDGEDEVVHWDRWTAGNEVTNIDSLQRGARNFVGYCSGCHSLKYSRYSRVAADLNISDEQLEQSLVLPGDSKNGYMLSTLSAADGEAWFGKQPPDLSLIARARSTDYIYQFLKTYYVDPNTATGVNNLALPGTAMPHVLSELQGVQAGVFREVPVPAQGETPASTKVEFLRFEDHVAGRLSAAEYDEFVRDIVNFLDYVGEPGQARRMSLGIWVVLFLLVFTGIAWLLKQEYWKDVK
jgi:ubiquinol-cytochrome c reductase cytochrome c1 subunit